MFCVKNETGVQRLRQRGVRNFFRQHVEKVIRKPKVIDKIDKPVLMAIGELNKTLSLCVLYKKAKQGIRIITFFPAEKGRYEYKILQGR